MDLIRLCDKDEYQVSSVVDTMYTFDSDIRIDLELKTVWYASVEERQN